MQNNIVFFSADDIKCYAYGIHIMIYEIFIKLRLCYRDGNCLRAIKNHEIFLKIMSFDTEIIWKALFVSNEWRRNFFTTRNACNEAEWTRMHASEIFIKENFHNRTRYRPRCFSEALGVVKKICTHSSAARSSVKRQRKRPSDLLFLSLLFFSSASFNRRRKISFRDYTSYVSYVSNSSVIIDADHVDRRLFLRKGGIWGRLRFRRCTRSREIEGCAAFQTRSECFLSPARRVQYQNEQKR